MYDPTSTHQRRWAAILAGGDGTRLQAFTEQVCGERRPKQFSRLLGTRTLLASTRLRLCHTVAPQRTVCVVTKHHQPFYADEFAGTAPQLVIEQPANRGTAIAIVYALARIARQDPHAVIGLFPSDHHYDNESVFQHALDGAYALASYDASRVVLLGARADQPETDYGWIARGTPVSAPVIGRAHAAHVVAGFHEKPDRATAAALLAQGAVWNTFVMVGHAGAFISLLTSAAPVLRSTFEWLRRAADPAAERDEAETLYATLPAVDFSREVLATEPSRLLVLTLPSSGWTDLGQASRIQAILAQRDHQIGLAAS